MLLSSLNSPNLWKPFLTQPVFTQSLEWILANAGTASEGIHGFGEPGWFVNVHGYTTKEKLACEWENHTATIDIQYLISGVEGIAVQPVAALGEPILYKAASDTQKYALPAETGSLVVLEPADFVIFLPGEAHCPKIAIGEPAPLKKLVVKIPVSMLAWPYPPGQETGTSSATSGPAGI